jgi:pimeloyl-ACP methyl ester carboxylesterase
MGPGNTLPAKRLAAITQPVLVLTGGNSPAWITKAGKAVAATIPGAVHRVLDGQTHDVSRTALAPELLEFFTA